MTAKEWLKAYRERNGTITLDTILEEAEKLIEGIDEAENEEIKKHKCDHCQKEYEPYKSFETETSVDKCGMHRKIIDTHYFDRVGLLCGDGIDSDYDLCQDCAKELLMWLENRTTVPNKRTVIANPSTTQRFTERKVKSIENGIVTYYDE